MAMPVILTTGEEIETWLTAPTPIALRLQKPLPEGALQVVARGEKQDVAPACDGTSHGGAG
jgi:putative SOS response-associated peptidase YedK